MAARRCTGCGINFPWRGHVLCDGCGERTDPISNIKPHDDWLERAAEVRHHAEEAEREVPSILRLEIPVTERNGRLFLSSWDVCRAGYQTPLEPDTLVHVGKQVLRIIGYIDSRREYWVEDAAKEAPRGELQLECNLSVRKRALRQGDRA